MITPLIRNIQFEKIVIDLKQQQSNHLLPSILLTGLPEVGVENVFSLLVSWIKSNRANKNDHCIAEINLANYRRSGVNDLIQELRQEISDFFGVKKTTENQPSNVSNETRLLRKLIKHLSKENLYVTFIVSQFDDFLKFPDAGEVEVLLNCFQSIGSESQYNSSFIIQTYREIEDICTITHYSDFYKIFSYQYIYRFTSLPQKQLCSYAEHRELSDTQFLEAIQFAGLFPEHLDLYLSDKFLDLSDKETAQATVNKKLHRVFDTWDQCISSEEKSVLKATAQNSINYLNISNLKAIQSKLALKGLLIETAQGYHITSPLFVNHLERQEGKLTNNTVPRVLKSANLVQPVLHQEILEQLFVGRYIIEWDCIQNLSPDHPTVYKVTGEDKSGNEYRPSIVKIHRADSIDKEVTKTEKAKDLLGPIVPSIINQFTKSRQKAIVLEYATRDNLNYRVRNLSDFIQDHSLNQIKDVLESICLNYLRPFYKACKREEKKATQVYNVPKKRRNEFDALNQQCESGSNYNRSKQQWEFSNKIPPIPSLFNLLNEASETLFTTKFPIGICRIHGDFHPRNILVDSSQNPFLIDFATMKEDGGRFTDLTRLEAELRLSMANNLALEDLVALDYFYLKSDEPATFELLQSLPLSDSSAKRIGCIAILRDIAKKTYKQQEIKTNIRFEYDLALLSNLLRICLFDKYLNNHQMQYGLILGSLLTQNLTKQGYKSMLEY